jgi:hypothetical protein
VTYKCWKMNKVGGGVPPVQHGSWSGLSSNLAFCTFVKGEINVFERNVVVLRISGKLFEGEFNGILLIASLLLLAAAGKNGEGVNWIVV